MKRFLQVLFVINFWFAVFGIVPSSFALSETGDNPQIALNVFQASPGATIEISGGRFQPDIFVTIAIAQNGMETQLTKIIADDHGEFTTTILLPMNLQIGAAEFHAIDEKNRVAIAPLAIIADESGEQQNGQRSEEDPLLVPMPKVLSEASTAVPPTLMPEKSESPKHSDIPFPWIAGGVGVILVLGLVLRIKR